VTAQAASEENREHRHETELAVFIGGSAGALEVLAELLSRLPRELAAPVLVVLHLRRAGTSVLPAILDRAGGLHAIMPLDGELLANGVVYVAPSDRQMLVEDGRVRLVEGPAEHGMRPAIDPLFRSAARACGPRAIGVVLSGMLDDGTAGLREIHARGGWTLVQDPDEAMFPSMPRSAIANVEVDAVLPIVELAARIEQLVGARRRRAGTAAPMPGAHQEADSPEPPGMHTDIACPRCGGLLWEQVDDRLTTYRCQAGHLYSPDSLLAVQGEDLDTAIWKPIRMLQERGALLQRLAQRATDQGRERSARYFRDQARESMLRATEMRRAVSEPDAEPKAGGAERHGKTPTETERR
jgi:two-component system, chemotaxis family, protein-glutamate methylesterase/glutaminase